MFKNYIFSLMISLLIIPAYLIGSLIGGLVAELFFKLTNVFSGGVYGWPQWFTILFGSALGGWLAGSGTAVLITMIYKKFNLHIVMILPILLTIFGLYKEVTYANEMGWGLIPFGALIRIVICISALFYLLRESSQKREYQEKI